jgi:hypothetical protein
MKYTVNGVTACGALMPVPAGASAFATTHGMVHINGQPSRPTAAPKPAAIPDGPLMRSAQPSYNSPDRFNPSIYYTTITNMHPGNNTIRVKSNNEVPVPAQPSNRNPGIAFRPARFGGQQQISWPPAPQSWQNAAVNAAGGY